MPKPLDSCSSGRCPSPLPEIHRAYGVSPDAQRFLIISAADTNEEAEPAEIHVVLNWFQELERLAPLQE